MPKVEDNVNSAAGKLQDTGIGIAAQPELVLLDDLAPLPGGIGVLPSKMGIKSIPKG